MSGFTASRHDMMKKIKQKLENEKNKKVKMPKAILIYNHECYSS
jgi:hypothetical protein